MAPSGYEIRLKASALENLKGARERLRARLGSRNVSDAITGLSAADAGKMANDLLALLDAIDSVVSRAKAVD